VFNSLVALLAISSAQSFPEPEGCAAWVGPSGVEMNYRAVQDLYDDMLRKMRRELPPLDLSIGRSAKEKAESEARSEARSRLAKERRAAVDMEISKYRCVRTAY